MLRPGKRSFWTEDLDGGFGREGSGGFGDLKNTIKLKLWVLIKKKM